MRAVRVARGRKSALATALALGLAGAVVGVTLADADGPQSRAGRTKELPRGGTKVFPDYRVVSFYGAPQADALGALGTTGPKKAARRLNRQARPYGKVADKPIYPAFELIATIAQADPGGDGKYRYRQPDRIVRRYLKEAKRHRFLLLLDIQPGRSTMIEEARHLRGWLRNRNVSLALDPEWNMGKHGVPGERIGHVSAGQVNKVSRLLSKISRKHDLPQKPLVIHRFTDDMVRHERRLRDPKGMTLLLNADGFGSPKAKREKYRQLAPRHSPPFPGFKLFYEEDSNLMSPRQVMRLKPRPVFIAYE